MFTDPKIENELFLVIWATAATCLLSTSYTLVNIPYGALAPDLTKDFDEVTVLNGFRMSFAVVGTLTGAILAPVIYDSFTNNPSLGWSLMGTIMGSLMLSSALITFFTIKEKKLPQKKEKGKETQNIFRSYIMVLQNKAFVLALIPWIFFSGGVTIIQISIIYYFKYIYNQEGMFVICLGILLVSSLICIPVWVLISKRISKKSCYNIGMSIFTIAILLFFFLGEQLGIGFAFIIMGIAGTGLSTNYVMPYALVPDIIEYDYSKTKIRREGIFYGTWTFANKIGHALAFLTSNIIFTIINYNPDDSMVTSMEKFGIKLLCGPVPAFFFIMGIIILSFYPINKEFYNNILNKIKEKEKQ